MGQSRPGSDGGGTWGPVLPPPPSVTNLDKIRTFMT